MSQKLAANDVVGNSRFNLLSNKKSINEFLPLTRNLSLPLGCEEMSISYFNDQSFALIACIVCLK